MHLAFCPHCTSRREDAQASAGGALAFVRRHQLDDSPRDADRPCDKTHHPLAQNDAADITHHDVVGVDSAVHRPVAHKAVQNRQNSFHEKSSSPYLDTRSISQWLDRHCPFQQKTPPVQSHRRNFYQYQQSDTDCPLSAVYSTAETTRRASLWINARKCGRGSTASAMGS